MDLDVLLIGKAWFINMIITLAVTAVIARNKTNNLPLVGFYSTLGSLLFFPFSWGYCYYWWSKPQLPSRDA